MSNGKSFTFISYARRDGREFAHRLRHKLEAEGFTIWQDVVSETPGEGWWQNIVEAIDGSSVMILVLTRAAFQSQIVQDEWLYARKVGTFIVPVIPHEEYFSALDEAGHVLIPRWLKKLDLLVLNELFHDYNAHWNRLLRVIHDPPPRKPVPFMVPALFDKLVYREELEQRILDRLLDEDGLSPRADRTALVGAGGFGKTTLAQAVCSKPEIIEAFKDGVLWLTLGEDATNATIVQSLNEAIEALGGVGANSLLEAIRRLTDLLRERECLIVLDDIWQADLIEPFLGDLEDTSRPHKGCRAWLFTSREADVVVYLTFREGLIHVGNMDNDEAAAMLTNYVPTDIQPIPDIQRTQLAALATKLGEWPLLIRLSGYELRRVMIREEEVTLEKALAWLERKLYAKGFTAFDAPGAAKDPKKWRHKALSASIALSMEHFTLPEQKCLLELSIFSSDTHIPADVVHCLWKQSSGLEAFSRLDMDQLLRRFDGPFLRFNLAAETISLHDVMREYFSELLGKDSSRRTHNALLESYNLGRQPWHTVDDDGYLYSFLAYHLDAAGRDDELLALFADQGWMYARVERDNYTYTGYLQDLDLAWEQVAHAKALAQINVKQEPTAVADCIRCALIQTSINSLAGKLDPALVARAVETGAWQAERALAVAHQMPDNKKRTRLYLLLLQTSRLTAFQERTAQQYALETALATALDGMVATEVKVLRSFEIGHGTVFPSNPYDGSRTKKIVEIVPYLTGEQRTRALRQGIEASQTIADGYWQSVAIAALVPYLAGEQRANALRLGLEAALVNSGGQWIREDLVMPMPDELWRPDALKALTPHLDGDLLHQALETTLAIDSKVVRSRVLAALIPHLASAQQFDALHHGLTAALEIASERERAQALAALAPYLDGDLLHRAMEATLALVDEQWRAEALAALVPYADSDLLWQGVQTALEIEDWRPNTKTLTMRSLRLKGKQPHLVGSQPLMFTNEHWRAKILVALAPYLDGVLLSHAMETALTIVNELWRAQALAALIPYADGSLLRQGMQAIKTFVNVQRQVEVFAALVPHLEGELLRQGLEFALTISHGWSRAQILKKFAPYLDGDLLHQAMEAALAIVDEHWKAEVLVALAPRLEGELLRLGLEAAAAINHYDKGRAEVLAALAPLLNADLLGQGLVAARSIAGERYRVMAIAALIPYLTAEQRNDALRQALEATMAINHEEERVQALKQLVLYLDGDLLRQALKAALEIESWWLRESALTALAPHLEGELLRQGLEISRTKLAGWSRAEALTRLALYPEGELRMDLITQALEISLAIHHEEGRVRALERLAPHLDGDLLCRALNAVLEIAGEKERAQALAALAPHLEGKLLYRGVEAAQTIADGYWQSVAVAALAPYLTGEQRVDALRQGLEAALVNTCGKWDKLHTSDDFWRAEALKVLIPQLDGDLLHQALETGLAFAGEDERAKVLAALAPHLEGELLRRALEATLELSWRLRERALAALVPHLEGELLRQALEVALPRSGVWSAEAYVSMIGRRCASCMRQGMCQCSQTSRHFS